MKRITCGIVGYAGNGEALPILLDGLSRLEYVHPEAYAAGELKHGTISLITQNIPVVAVITDKSVAERLHQT